MDNEINPQELVGRTVTNIFETKVYSVQDGIPGPASYFDIVVEIDRSDLYELGAHSISKWKKNENLIPAVQNDPDIIGQRITKVIQRDPEEYYDGSLILLLESNFVIEHVTTNGDQLQFGEFDDEATDNLEIFRKDFLKADAWPQRKDGVPLDLLDNLSSDELKTAEQELLKAVSLRDDWPIIGLGHIKSKEALPILYNLLEKSKGAMKVTIAHSIFQISADEKMKDIVFETMPKITGEFELINVLYYLPGFKDKRITDLHLSYRNHNKYLVAYNATQALGLPTDEVVQKFRDKKEKGFWNKLFG